MSAPRSAPRPRALAPAILFLATARLALRSITANKARTLLTLFGVVLGTGGLVVVSAVLQLLDTGLKTQLMAYGAGTFRAQREARWADDPSESERSRRPALTQEHVRLLAEKLTLVDLVSPELWSWGHHPRVGRRWSESSVAVVGGAEAFLELNALALDQGRPLLPVDLEARTQVAVIGAAVVEQLFPDGPASALGAELELRGHRFRVVGTTARVPVSVEDDKNARILVPLTTFERLFGGRSLFITMRARNPADSAEAMEEARGMLRRARGLRPEDEDDFLLTSNTGSEEILRTFSRGIAATLGGISLIALVIGAIGVMNITLASVNQRTREIGLRGALGARPGMIRAQFLAEAVIVTGVGGALGLGLAWAVVAVIGLAFQGSSGLPVTAALVGLATTTLTGLLAGSYPAARAARLQPVAALRAE